MYRFLKGCLFCALALLIGAKTGALMVKFFPDFTTKFASVFAINGDTDDSTESFGNHIEVDVLEDDFFQHSIGSKLMHTSTRSNKHMCDLIDFDLPTDTVP
jgi:hypothetical protein